MRLRKNKDVEYFIKYITSLNHGEFIALITAVALVIENMNKKLLRAKKSADGFSKFSGGKK